MRPCFLHTGNRAISDYDYDHPFLPHEISFMGIACAALAAVLRLIARVSDARAMSKAGMEQALARYRHTPAVDCAILLSQRAVLVPMLL
jgi:hypothetical protein